MGTGTLSLMLFCGMVGTGDSPLAMRDRNIQIPYNLSVNPADVSEVILFVSIDQGRVWSRAGVIRPTDKHFPFQAPTDGLYWFNVAVAYKNGSQVPADVSQSPPQQKVLFDTQKPSVRLISADRFGDDVVVSWEVQEPNPDLAALKLEYRPADAPAGGYAYPVSISPGLMGQARFRPNMPGPLTVKVAMSDTAGNVGWAERNVAGAAVANAVVGVEPIRQTTAMSSPAAAPMPPPPVDAFPQPHTHLTPPPADNSQHMTLASSARPDAVRNGLNGLSPSTPTAYTTLRSELPRAHHTRDAEITIDYQIEHQGPSGISKVEVFITQNDGRSWMSWQNLTRNEFNRGELGPVTNMPVTIRLPQDEGVFGFRLVPHSGTLLSVGAPQSGDAPELRIQVDKSAPFVELYKPEPDAKDVNVLSLIWKATDANLTDAPIQIYWADTPNGEWKPISVNAAGAEIGLPNTGRYSWQLPASLPMKVFLKIVAIDQAGNVGEAVTPQPVSIDLHRPIGRVKGVVGKR